MRAANWQEMLGLYAQRLCTWTGGNLCDTAGMAAKALRVMITSGAPGAAEVFKMRGASLRAACGTDGR